MSVLLSKLGKFILDVLLSKAAQEVYEDIALHLLDKGVKSTETKWDDEMAKVIKETIDAKK
jgi:hypothetical protein